MHSSSHNFNVDRTLDQLATYVDDDTRSALLKFLLTEEDKLANDQQQLQDTEQRIADRRLRIERICAIVDGLVKDGLMHEDKFSKAVTMLQTMQEAQTLIERRYRSMNGNCRLFFWF